MFPVKYLFFAAWLVFIVVWIIGARSTKPTLRRSSLRLWIGLILLVWVAALLLYALAAHHVPLQARLWPTPYPVQLLGALLTWAGIAFAIWARIALGSNWSGQPTVKKDHELITTGPYAYARHPIYTGLLLAFLGSVLAFGEARALCAVVLALAALVYKIRVEEQLMTETFPTAYPAYRQRVKALIPWIL
jgi:protein-S-isoprenylcysteine O-methyltransferase Ste14